MNNRVLNINDIENSIEIFGNEFELEFSENYINRLRSVDIKRLQNIDVKNIQDNNVFEALKEMLNKVLNDDNAYDKIKNSYESEKQKEFGLQTFIRVFEFIFNQYVEEMNNMNKKMSGIIKPNYQNREQRRNNYKGNYRGNYRRY